MSLDEINHLKKLESFDKKPQRSNLKSVLKTQNKIIINLEKDPEILIIESLPDLNQDIEINVSYNYDSNVQICKSYDELFIEEKQERNKQDILNHADQAKLEIEEEDERYIKKCIQCADLIHPISECRMVICSFCKLAGHMFRNCEYKRTSISTYDGKQCLLCKTRNHNAGVCLQRNYSLKKSGE